MDVGLVDHVGRRLLVVECVNSVGHLGASIRSSDGKHAEAEELAIALGHGEPYAVCSGWVVRDTRRNRRLVARHPEVFATRFAGSSAQWARALTTGSMPPRQRGLVWADVRATCIFAWRRATA